MNQFESIFYQYKQINLHIIRINLQSTQNQFTINLKQFTSPTNQSYIKFLINEKILIIIKLNQFINALSVLFGFKYERQKQFLLNVINKLFKKHQNMPYFSVIFKSTFRFVL